MEKASGSTARYLKKNEELELTNYQITVCHFSHMFHMAEELLYFDKLGVTFNEFEDNFVFACNFPAKLSNFNMN